MATDIYVVSGFLGAGKTTLIQKFLREGFKDEKVVLIENDFGEVSVDTALLKATGADVKEINSGCICCSLQGDFVDAIAEIVESHHPDKIIIEPSGVAKLSDIIKACSNIRVNQAVTVRSKMTVVDLESCQDFLDGFGEFFEDQIRHADIILLSRCKEFPHLIDNTCELINNLNPQAFVFAKPWDQINVESILACIKSTPPHGHSQHAVDLVSSKHCTHEHHEHHEHSKSTGAHLHGAEAVFDTITLYPHRVFTIEELQSRLITMQQTLKGHVLRLKGIVHGVNGNINLQYVPGSVQISESTAEGNFICVIGSNLSHNDLVAIFDWD